MPFSTQSVRFAPVLDVYPYTHDLVTHPATTLSTSSVFSYWIKVGETAEDATECQHVNKGPANRVLDETDGATEFRIKNDADGAIEILLGRLIPEGYLTTTAGSVSGTLTFGAWHHIVVELDLTHEDPSQRVSLWVDGEPVALTFGFYDFGATTLYNIRPFHLGGWTSAGAANLEPFWLDEWAYWGGAGCSDAVALELYNDGCPGDLAEVSIGLPTVWLRFEGDYSSEGDDTRDATTGGSPEFSSSTPCEGEVDTPSRTWAEHAAEAGLCPVAYVRIYVNEEEAPVEGVDVYSFTSHPGFGLPASLASFGDFAQEVDPRTFEFKTSDLRLSFRNDDSIRRVLALYDLQGRPVEFYLGFNGMALEAFRLIHTFQFRDASIDEGGGVQMTAVDERFDGDFIFVQPGVPQASFSVAPGIVSKHPLEVLERVLLCSQQPYDDAEYDPSDDEETGHYQACRARIMPRPTRDVARRFTWNNFEEVVGSEDFPIMKCREVLADIARTFGWYIVQNPDGTWSPRRNDPTAEVDATWGRREILEIRETSLYQNTVQGIRATLCEAFSKDELKSLTVFDPALPRNRRKPQMELRCMFLNGVGVLGAWNDDTGSIPNLYGWLETKRGSEWAADWYERLPAGIGSYATMITDPAGLFDDDDWFSITYAGVASCAGCRTTGQTLRDTGDNNIPTWARVDFNLFPDRRAYFMLIGSGARFEVFADEPIPEHGAVTGDWPWAKANNSPFRMEIVAVDLVKQTDDDRGDTAAEGGDGLFYGKAFACHIAARGLFGTTTPEYWSGCPRIGTDSAGEPEWGPTYAVDITPIIDRLVQDTARYNGPVPTIQVRTRISEIDLAVGGLVKVNHRLPVALGLNGLSAAVFRVIHKELTPLADSAGAWWTLSWVRNDTPTDTEETIDYRDPVTAGGVPVSVDGELVFAS